MTKDLNWLTKTRWERDQIYFQARGRRL